MTKNIPAPGELEEFRVWLIDYLSARRVDDPLTLRLFDYVVALLEYDASFYKKLTADPVEQKAKMRAVPGPHNLVFLERPTPAQEENPTAKKRHNK